MMECGILFGRFNRFVNSPVAVYNNPYSGTAEAYNLPFNMNTFYRLFGVVTPGGAKQIIKQEVHDAWDTKGGRYGRKPKNLKEQAISLVGTTIFEKLIKGYTEKQWGRSCEELPPEIIKRIPLRFTYDNDYFGDRHQGIPVDGYTALVQNMLDGIEVRLGIPYAKCGSIAHNVIYTGSIDEYFDYMLGMLQYRSLSFDTRWSYMDNYQGNAVINYTSAQIPNTRTIEHCHFDEARVHNGTIITDEYPCEWSIGRERYYPINDRRNVELYKRYKKLAEDTNTVFCGRLGEYKYYNMDQTIAKALTLAKAMCK